MTILREIVSAPPKAAGLAMTTLREIASLFELAMT